jgi:antitoxin HigA-1
MTSTDCVLSGRKEMPQMLKSSITTKSTGKGRLPLIPPGQILKEEFLDPLHLSINALALALRVPATRILAIVKGERTITADTALRLSRYFGNSAEFWLNLQQFYDLRCAQLASAKKISAEVLPRDAA